MSDETMYDRIMLMLNRRNETPGHMCSALGVRRGMISDLKSGKNASLSASNVAMIADYLHVTCDYLIRGKDPFASLPLDEISLLNAWRVASDEEKENVAFILRKRGFNFTSRNYKTEKQEQLA